MSCNPQSGWLTVVQVGAAALTPVIAIVGGWIAWQQVRTNRNKLKLDRFDKRYAIYEAAIKFITAIITTGRVDNSRLIEFTEHTRGTRFLFNAAMADYVDAITRAALTVQYLRGRLARDANTDEERVRFGDDLSEQVKWLMSQLEPIPDKFAPFLSVDDI